MTPNEFQTALVAALSHPTKRVLGVTRADVERHTKWSRLGGFGRIDVEGVTLTVREFHDSTAPIDEATWYTVSAPRSKAFDVTRGMTILTTEGDE